MVTQTTIKDHIRESRLFNDRIIFALAIAGLLLVALVVRLSQLQIVSSDHFSTLSKNNYVNVQPVPPIRGLIYDRNGVVLAQNVPTFSLEVIPERTDDMNASIAKLKEIIDISDDQLERFRKTVKQRRGFHSIPLRFRLNEAEVARFAVNRFRFPGFDIQARLIRDYPLGSLAVHSIGYIGRINEKELQTIDASNYSGSTHIGKTGVEAFYEPILHGRVGLKKVEVNVLGRTIRTLEEQPAIPGRNIYLTLDAELQSIAEKALAGRNGSIVAIKPDNGDVLVIASTPTYDPNAFVTGIDNEQFASLQSSIDNPLFNRSLQGQYPPGSTVKPFIGLAALESETIFTHAKTFCPGWYSLPGGSHRYRDWKKIGHGVTTLNKAIIESCDVYFYDLAYTMGIDKLNHHMRPFGFGEKTGVDLPGELSGLMPTKNWKKENRNEPWYAGETIITGIGQGFSLATPLQLASATATFANKGIKITPHILHATKSNTDKEIIIKDLQTTRALTVKNPENWDYITQAMTNVIHNIHGTARSIGKNINYKIAGKTGTAQVFGIKQGEKYNKEDIKEKLRDHALFIAFAPVNDPKIAIAVVVENGGSGGSVAAPIAGKLIKHFLRDTE